MQPLSLDRFGEPLHDFPALTLACATCGRKAAAQSTLAVLTRAPHPGSSPTIWRPFDDRRVAADAIRLARRLAAARALARYAPLEFKPGARLQDEDALVKAASEVGTTIFHPVGTAEWAPPDSRAVVDERLGFSASADCASSTLRSCRRITSGNTNSPTMMIAEKAADMILADAKSA